ncbi:MAG: hypothetical protein ACOCV8_02985 [Spirochaetota bacterium]
MRKSFEYKFVTAEQYEEFEYKLNQEGKTGWDLVNYTIREVSDSEGDKIHIQALMKRELLLPED